jgi:hypothetical protein
MNGPTGFVVKELTPRGFDSDGDRAAADLRNVAQHFFAPPRPFTMCNERILRVVAMAMDERRRTPR